MVFTGMISRALSVRSIAEISLKEISDTMFALLKYIIKDPSFISWLHIGTRIWHANQIPEAAD